jgi:hypothetical protein
MADTRVQRTIEEWIRQSWLQGKFNKRFQREHITLTCGGEVEIDAVSDDGSVLAIVSTSGLMTASGRQGVGKILAIRAKLYYLLLIRVHIRLVLLTDDAMYQYWLNEQARKKVPEEIIFYHVELPEYLQAQLHEARTEASREMTPFA